MYDDNSNFSTSLLDKIFLSVHPNIYEKDDSFAIQVSFRLHTHTHTTGTVKRFNWKQILVGPHFLLLCKVLPADRKVPFL